MTESERDELVEDLEPGDEEANAVRGGRFLAAAESEGSEGEGEEVQV